MKLTSMLGCCLVLLFFILEAGAQADLYFIKNHKSGTSACYTNDTNSTVAFIQELKKISKNEELNLNVERLDSLGQHSNLQQYDCDLVITEGCNTWSKEEFQLLNNIDSTDTFEAISDLRWNRLPAVFTDGSFTHRRFPNKIKSSGKINLSILALHTAQLLISGNENLETGYSIVLDGWNPYQSRLRYCSKIPKKNPSECEILTDIGLNYDFTRKGEQWLHITIDYNLENDSAHAIEVKSLSDVIMKWNSNGRLSQSVSYIAARTYADRGIYKLHEYSYLKQKMQHQTAIMSKIVHLNQSQSICFDVIYKTGNIPLTVRVNDTKYELISNVIWKTYRIQTKILDIGEHLIEIKSGDQLSLIGGPVLWKSNSKSSVSCMMLKTESKTVSVINDKIKSPGPLTYDSKTTLDLCRVVGSSECSGIKTCDSIGCFCTSGHNGTKCESRCMRKYYGSDCNLYNEGKCKNGSYSVHSAECPEGCKSGYKRPFCLKKLLTLKKFPTPMQIEAFKVALNFEESFNLLGDEFGYAKIKYKKANAPEEFLTLNISKNNPAEVWIKGLDPSSIYTYTVEIIEQDGQYLPNTYFTNFTTKSCIPLSNQSLSITVNDSVISWKKIGPNQENVCRVQSLIISTGETKLLEESIGLDLMHTHFQSFEFKIKTSYAIKLSGEDDSVFLIEFSNPGPLEQAGGHFVIGAVSASVVLIAVLATVFFWRRRKHAKNTNQVLINQNSPPEGKAVELDLLPMPERSATRKSYFARQNDPFSKIVGVAELEKYIENAITTDLLKKQHEQFPQGQTQTWSVGVDPANKKKNRYANLAAYDATRVQLSFLPGDDHSDYINANYIDGYKRPHAYIATQGSKPQTVNDFWRMVWQENVSVIVMVANLVENEKSKCVKYWPDVKQTTKHGNVDINNTQEEVFSDFVVRTFIISSENANRTITQMHYTTWPDHGVPIYTQSVAQFAHKLIKMKTETPIVVHCSSGVGRTGTIILIDASLRMALAEGIVDVLALLTKMRSQRANMVDNHQQYEFVHLVLLEALVVPQFAVPCKDFHSEYESLTAFKGSKIIKQFKKINSICDKEWNRANKKADIPAKICRYPDIVASSNQLVKIFPYGSVTQTTFLNGVYVDGFRKKRPFIATQVPLSNTVEHFWRTVQQHKVGQIIVLNEFGPMEGQYLPEGDEALNLGDDLNISLQNEIELKYGLSKTIVISENGKSPVITNVLCTRNWAVGQLCGIGASSLVELWEETERSRGSGVSVVVCHDGVTSSGLFLGVGFVLEKIKLEQQVDVALALRTLRHSRPNFISTVEQYQFLFKSAITYLQSFETYGNFQ
ncbi:receptor-type tyrosine-protein phosphatase C-like isoform X2 [Neocloeon triangulifer]|uniref:receptor-type tyrosine-protein phosphatase C-like isoform X2 n=1 Tax=Neocloeon triangulifer TaxID=2078957 RepID=UPI00286F4A4B|nr:receptor-type tyrosine-protein phosphatase C-like isoform X2 [Neocloeon triangulifer]